LSPKPQAVNQGERTLRAAFARARRAAPAILLLDEIDGMVGSRSGGGGGGAGDVGARVLSVGSLSDCILNLGFRV